MEIDYSDAISTLLPLFKAATPFVIAWGLGTKALKCLTNVICGKDLYL